MGIWIVAVACSCAAADKADNERIGMPQDWSHRHVVVTNAADLQTRVTAQSDPRMVLRWMQRSRGQATTTGRGARAGGRPIAKPRLPKKVDWSISLGPAGSMAPLAYPAKFSFDVNATPSCTQDFAVYPIDVVGVTGGQANLVAFNQLYRSTTGGLCGSGTGGNGLPDVMWAYNATTVPGGKIATSPTLSLNGSKVAFVETAAGAAVFHVLTWDPCTPSGCGSGVNNGASATASAAPGTGNAASMSSLQYSSSSNTLSSPWIDYRTDSAYVGDDNGKLYRITGVFYGTPAVDPAWAGGVTVSTAACAGCQRLSSPVYDLVTGNIFVGDQSGRLYAVNSVTRSVVASLEVGRPNADICGDGGNGIGYGLTDAPLVDPSTGSVFAFSGNDGTSAVVVQAATATLTELARARVGQGGVCSVANGVNIHAGAFSNAYYALPSSGHLYVCGTKDNASRPYLYRFGFTGTLLNTVPSGTALQLGANGSNGQECSPLTEMANGIDRLFVGIEGSCTINGGPGCLKSFDISAGMPVASITAPRTQPGGTSGIIVDNISSGAEASSVYFATQGTGGNCGAANYCAVKLTQSALQ